MKLGSECTSWTCRLIEYFHANLEEKYNNKIYTLREQLFLPFMSLQHGRRLTIYNPKATFWKSSQYNGDTDIKMPNNIFPHFIGYYLALQYSCLLNLNKILESYTQICCSFLLAKLNVERTFQNVFFCNKTLCTSQRLHVLFICCKK